MNENDNILIEQFFQEAAQQQIEDNGFSERVMAALPVRRINWLSHLWTMFCIAVAAVVFVLTQGWTVVLSHLAVFLTNVEVFFRTLPTLFDLSMLSEVSQNTSASLFLDVLLALVVLLVLWIVGITRWVSRWAW